MLNHEERLAALEQNSVTRTEFTKAMNDLTWQVRQTLSDRNKEMTLALGPLTDDVRVLKEKVTALRVNVNDGFSDLSQELYTVDERLRKRLGSLETNVTSLREEMNGRFSSLETKVNQHTELLTQILARLPEKP